MGARRQKRIQLRSAVRIYGTDANGKPFSRSGETLDVSPSGLRLSGVFVALKDGDEVDIECERGKARCRVIWRGEIGRPNAGEVALCTVDQSIVLWPADDPNWVDDFDAASVGAERRFYRRFNCELPAYFTCEGATTVKPGRCTDLSFGGCYIETPDPPRTESRLSVSVYPVASPLLAAYGFVRTRHPGMGMGVRFTHLDDPKALAATLDYLRNAVPKPVARSVTMSGVGDTRRAFPERGEKTLLVVDDSLTARNIMAHHLRRHGYGVALARGGEEGLALAKTLCPNMILLDIMMPRLSGLAVLRQLKADGSTARIPVLVISSLSEENDARVLAEGACGYFAKANTSPDKLPLLVDRTFEHLLRESPTQD